MSEQTHQELIWHCPICGCLSVDPYTYEVSARGMSSPFTINRCEECELRHLRDIYCEKFNGARIG